MESVGQRLRTRSSTAARGTGQTVLTCPVGLVSFRGHTGQAAAHVVHRNHPKLVVDVRREAQDS